MSDVQATGTVLQFDEVLALAPAGAEGDDEFALRLDGTDLPPVGERVVVEGRLEGRVLAVTAWRPAPRGTSSWAIPVVAGTDAKTVESVDVGGTPEDWPIISFGTSLTTSGGHVVVLEVDQVTDEIRDWVESQPAGAVHLIAFISPAAATASS